MEGTGWTRAAFTFGAFAVAALVTTFTNHLYIGGPAMAVVFGGIAARCWYLGG